MRGALDRLMAVRVVERVGLNEDVRRPRRFVAYKRTRGRHASNKSHDGCGPRFSTRATTMEEAATEQMLKVGHTIAVLAATEQDAGCSVPVSPSSSSRTCQRSSTCLWQRMRQIDHCPEQGSLSYSIWMQKWVLAGGRGINRCALLTQCRKSTKPRSHPFRRASSVLFLRWLHN